MRIRFLHIPKTAGTSFSNCLRRIYRANRVRNNLFVFLGDFRKDVERYESLSREQREGIVMVSGHSPLTTGVTDIDSMPTMTFLRDPVERLKSLFQHMSEGKINDIDPERIDIDALLDLPSPWFRNLQTRVLLGNNWSYDLPDWPDEKIVETATEVLTHRLSSFGITGQFDDSLLLFQIQLNWKRFPVYVRLNERNPDRLLKFTPEQEARMREYNALDLALYANAEKVFQDRLDAHADLLKIRRQQFRWKQALAQPYLSVFKLYHEGKVRAIRSQHSA